MSDLERYQKRPSQEKRILDLLKSRVEKGVFVWEFMLPRNQGGLGIAQYNARIWGLRRKGYQIENIRPGFFVLGGGRRAGLDLKSYYLKFDFA